MENGSRNIFFQVIGATLVVSLLVFSALIKNINWDEFFYLSKVYRLEAGEIASVYQSIHARIFYWLIQNTLNEVTQIQIARLLALCFLLLSTTLIFKISKHFLDTRGSVLAALLFLTFPSVIYHGAEFRADPFSLFFLLLAIFIVLERNCSLLSVLAASLLFTVSLLITIKSALYLPVITAVILSRNGCSIFAKSILLLVFVLVALATFKITIFWHGSDVIVANVGANLVVSAIEKTFAGPDFFPRRLYFIISLITTPSFWIISTIGFFSILVSIRNYGISIKTFTLLVFCGPIFVIIFYRNAYPYYYPSLIALLSIVASFGWSKFLLVLPSIRRVKFWTIVLYSIFAMNLLVSAVYRPSKGVTAIQQKEFLKEVHRIFPHRVSYIDSNSMISSFRSAAFFMSSWGVENYLSGANRNLVDIVNEDAPVFVLVNREFLDIFDKRILSDDLTTTSYMKEVDKIALIENYIHYWGPIFLLGKEFRNVKSNSTHNFTILKEGFYTVQGSGGVVIDDHEYDDGEAVWFTTGDYSFRSRISAKVIIFEYGLGRYKPVTDFHLPRLFERF